MSLSDWIDKMRDAIGEKIESFDYSQDVPLELVTASRTLPAVGSTTSPADADVVVSLWHPKRGELTHIAVGNDGEVWGVNDEHIVYRWDPSSSSSSGWDKK